MPFTDPLPALPDPNAPLVGADGRINPVWFTFLRRLLEWLARFAAST